MSSGSSNSKLAWVLAGALGVALAAVAFLLGRESTRAEVQAEAPAAFVARPEPAVEPEPEPTPFEEPVEEPEPAPAPVADDASAERIDAYFAEMKAIQEGESVSDPNAFAMELTTAASKGDTSGFDRLIGDTRRMETKVKTIKPPRGCEAHHAKSIALVAESRALLETLRGAVQSKDLSLLGSMSSRAQGLQERAKELEELEQKIRADR